MRAVRDPWTGQYACEHGKLVGVSGCDHDLPRRVPVVPGYPDGKVPAAVEPAAPAVPTWRRPRTVVAVLAVILASAAWGGCLMLPLILALRNAR